LSASVHNRLFNFVLLILVGLASLSACGRDETPPAGVESGPSAFGSRAVTRSADQSDGGGFVNAEPSFSVPDLTTTLDALESYRLEMAVSFGGQDSGGRPLDWQLTSQIEVVTGQPARRFELRVAGLDNGSQLQAISAAQIGAESYLAVPGVGCLAGLDAALNLGQHGPGAPTTYLAAILGAELAGPGDSSSGGTYHFDQAALPGWPAGQLTIRGLLLVDAGATYPSHVELSAAGSADYLALGQPQEGMLRLTLDISQVNALGQIQPPAECLGEAIYPMVADAFAVTVVDAFVSYRSHQPFSDILAFYQVQMPATGWTESAEAVVLQDSEPLALLTYQRHDTTVTISISLNLTSGATTVLITP
jgi:hypothetical protein